MDTLVFLIQGSADEPYQVRFDFEGEYITSFCTCPHAVYRRGFCKHKRRLLKGDPIDLVSDNADDVATLAELIEGTPLIGAIGDLDQLEDTITKAQRKRKALLARIKDILGE